MAIKIEYKVKTLPMCCAGHTVSDEKELSQCLNPDCEQKFCMHHDCPCPAWNEDGDWDGSSPSRPKVEYPLQLRWVEALREPELYNDPSHICG